MPTPKNKFKIGKKSKSASRQTSKKHSMRTNFQRNSPALEYRNSNTKTRPKAIAPSAGAKIVAVRFFGRKAPFSKAKKIYPVKKTMNADIVVKRSIYSKAARAAVLADAAARQRLIEMGGENTIDVIREFDRDMSDDELAKKTGIKPSEVRVVLNRLHNRGVFAYTRVRDRDSGWYSYIWKMDEGRLKDVGGAEVEEEAAQAICREGYHCPQCGGARIVEFEDAVDMQFKCGCGNSLEFVDGKRVPKE